MKITFRGPAGDLEGILEGPTGGGVPRAAAAVCHPHPRYGGTMRNSIVFRVARALQDAGLATLRFNFRGVEGSEGEHSGERGEGGEEGDALAALDRLAAEHPGVEQWLAGYSFGARTATSLAVRPDGAERIARVVGIALPVRVFDCSAVTELVQPALLLFGSRDEFGTLADLREAFPRLAPEVEADEIDGADHFFRGRTPRVEARVRSFAENSAQTREHP